MEVKRGLARGNVSVEQLDFSRNSKLLHAIFSVEPLSYTGADFCGIFASDLRHICVNNPLENRLVCHRRNYNQSIFRSVCLYLNKP